MNGASVTVTVPARVLGLPRTGRRPLAAVGDRRAPSLELRATDDGDQRVLRRLAALDDAPELEAPVLLASIDGDPVAAMSLRDGRVVADPFAATLEPVALLHLRARQIMPARARRWRRIPRLRLA